MQSKMEAIYKGIKENKAGSFVNDKGVTISYKDSYKLRFDQILNGLPKETEIKIPKELALNIAKNFTIYDKIVIDFNIVIYNEKNISLVINNITKK